MFDTYTHQIKYSDAISTHWKCRNKMKERHPFTFFGFVWRFNVKCTGTEIIFDRRGSTDPSSLPNVF